MNIFDPEVIVIGGGAIAAGELLLDPAREVLRERALPGRATSCGSCRRDSAPRRGCSARRLLALDEGLANRRRVATRPHTESPDDAGRLVVCPTPIGNLEDVTLRVLAALREADVRRLRGHAPHAGAARPLRRRAPSS